MLIFVPFTWHSGLVLRKIDIDRLFLEMLIDPKISFLGVPPEWWVCKYPTVRFLIRLNRPIIYLPWKPLVGNKIVYFLFALDSVFRFHPCWLIRYHFARSGLILRGLKRFVHQHVWVFPLSICKMPLLSLKLVVDFEIPRELWVWIWPCLNRIQIIRFLDNWQAWMWYLIVDPMSLYLLSYHLISPRRVSLKPYVIILTLFFSYLQMVIFLWLYIFHRVAEVDIF